MYFGNVHCASRRHTACMLVIVNGDACCLTRFFVILSHTFLWCAVHTEAVFWSRILSSAAGTVNCLASPGGFGLLSSAESSPVSFHPEISRCESSRKHVSGLYVTSSIWRLWCRCFSLSTSASRQQRLAVSNVIVGINLEHFQCMFRVFSKAKKSNILC